MSSEIEKEEQDSGVKWKKMKSAMSHVGLLVALMVYTVAGGMVFRALEFPAEVKRLEALNNSVGRQREHLLVVFNCTERRELHNYSQRMERELVSYELAVQEAVRGGVSLPLGDVHPRWNLVQAVFFASTVLTTIGYGNIVPVTQMGCTFCILFAMVGIPLTLTVIADMGCLFASAVSAVASRHLPRHALINDLNMRGRRSLYAVAAVLFLFLYLSVGAGLFMLWEDDWGFFEGFYFCFVTMTTIGFGDLVPKKPKYMLLCTLYILVGLALTSTIIELVRRQYADSWRRLQALSGPLAEAMRRLGETAGGGIDVTALHRMLTIISMPRRLQGDGEKTAKARQEWEEAMAAVLRDITAPQKPKPVIQIVIYESTV
ncbi:TWiK family of potassium channels protein 7 [Anabrus simplex]|uniref:TWiK family of potassium channels protein 7 n=1 Tax=Anabrus simplex TaxID=316456 RepID=UPI0034DD9A4F